MNYKELHIKGNIAMNKKLLSLSVAVLASSFNTTEVIAQEGRRAALEEVIVTSRRVEESVQSVPLAVTALSAEMLETKGIIRMNDLVDQTPALTSQGTSGRSTVVNFGIRGQRNTDVLPTADPSVIVYIADVPQMRGYGLGALGSLDIQTVEVLKGPQGTLFGRSTTGGAVVITPNAPTQDLTGSVSVGVGQYDRKMARAIVNAPITDNVAVRVAVQSEKTDGYIDNKGRVGRDSFNQTDELVWRAALQFSPTDALTTTFYTDGFESNDNGAMVDVSNINTGLQNGIVAGAGPAGAAFRSLFDRFNAEVAADGDPYSGRTNIENGYSNLTLYGVANVTTFDVSDTITIKNIIGYRYINVDDYWDLDGTSAPILQVFNVAKTHQYSEEFQVSGSYGDTFDWMGGIFWMREYSPDYSYAGALQAFGESRANYTQTGTNADNVSSSIFGQLIYHLTDDLNLTVGARANRDEREIENNSFNSSARGGGCLIQFADATFAPRNNCYRKESETFTEPSYSITLDYHLDADQMVYMAHRHGYRAGGFNGRAASVQLATPTRAGFDSFEPFEPETVDDIEFGYKGDLTLAGAPLRLNAAAFYSDYQEIQRLIASLTAAGTTATNVINAASAKLYGGELEATWIPLDGLQIDLFFAYLHAKYDEWNDLQSRIQDKSDFDFPAPVRSGGVTVRYTLPTPVELGAISVQGNVYAQSERQLADDNGPGGLQSGYSLVGARIDWQDVAGSKLKLSLWGKNLNNTRYYTGGVNVNDTLGYYMAYPGMARSWGLDATYDF
jgi:iron complex outermembrane receptor protein